MKRNLLRGFSEKKKKKKESEKCFLGSVSSVKALSCRNAASHMKKHFNRAVRLFLAWAEKEEKQNIWKLNCVCHTASCQLCQPREPLNPQSSSQFERCTSKGQHAGRSWSEVRGASQQRHLLYWERLTALQQQRERDGAHSSEAKEKIEIGEQNPTETNKNTVPNQTCQWKPQLDDWYERWFFFSSEKYFWWGSVLYKPSTASVRRVSAIHSSK